MSGSHSRLTAADLSPLHFAILKALPEEGSVLGYSKVARTARELTATLNKPLGTGVPKLTSAQVQAALRSLKIAGFTVSTRLGSGLGWQVTRQGEAVLEAAKPGSADPVEVIA